MCGSVSVSVSVSVLVGVCCQVNQCFNAFTTYTLFRSFRTTQRDRLLYSAFTDTNCALTDLERTSIKWEISPKWLHSLQINDYLLSQPLKTADLHHEFGFIEKGRRSENL